MPTSRLPSHLPPKTNFLKIYGEHTNIRGTYVIDPGMQMPQFVSSASEGKNLNLRGVNGSIDVEVWLVGDETKKAILSIGGENGPVTVKKVSICCLVSCI